MQLFPDHTFHLARTFNAPRELVFKAWTEADHMLEWWGPVGMTMRIAKMEFRPGGVFHYSMTTPDGTEMWGKFVYREIAPYERLVFVNCFADAAGNPIRHPMAPTWPLEMLSTLVFHEHDGKTTLEMSAIPINATDEESAAFAAAHASMQQGWKGTLEQLEAYLAQRGS